jgi:hypothetical protein
MSHISTSRSTSSLSRASNMSSHSVSPHSNDPLTPPEPATLGPQPTSSRSPRPIRRSTRPVPQSHPSSYEGSHGSYGDNAGYSPSMLMPPPSSYSSSQGYFTGASVSPHMSSLLRPHDTPYMGQYAGSPSHFAAYPQPYPMYPQYSGGAPISYTLSQQSADASQSGMYTDTEAEEEFTFPGDFEYDSRIHHTPPLPLSKLASPSKSPLKAQPPRPPNAWILYRSDRLKDISAGRVVKGLDAVMRDSGFSGSSASSGEESASGMALDGTKGTPATSVSGGTDDDKPKPVVRRKGKKGAKEPTEGLLRMGTGKTGRGLPQAHISKMISELWKREEPEIRREYEMRSEKKKNEAS